MTDIKHIPPAPLQRGELKCILFDLDGTLVDTAPDLIACLNYALEQHGFSAVAAEHVKPHVSFGATAMINASLISSPPFEGGQGECALVDNEKRAAILVSMLEEYETNIARHSQFFDGMLDVLNFIETQNLSWGIVTNKRERFTMPLVHALELQNRVACVICGDTTPNPKPHPAPLLEACKRANVSVSECVYIGDAAHDILAGRNAQMHTLAATYGYLQANETPEN
ncbi:MAG: HAD-IA family hydrolase, partial [Methylococcales bacterium]|nr:HAD-IA family hydrolase [Methylococcales bacterium]